MRGLSSSFFFHMVKPAFRQNYGSAMVMAKIIYDFSDY
jgi:hypothetical protein